MLRNVCRIKDKDNNVIGKKHTLSEIEKENIYFKDVWIGIR